MRKSTNWRRDPAIQERMLKVQRLHFAGRSNRAIAAELGVDEGTIRKDLDRLNEAWRERIGDEAVALRAQVVAELEDLRVRSLNAADFDEMCERAVLFGYDANGVAVWVQRDEKGSAQFRGNKAAALNTARQAVMDRAKVLGLIVEKQEHTTPIPVRVYEVDTSDAGSAPPLPESAAGD